MDELHAAEVEAIRQAQYDTIVELDVPLSLIGRESSRDMAALTVKRPKARQWITRDPADWLEAAPLPFLAAGLVWHVITLPTAWTILLALCVVNTTLIVLRIRKPRPPFYALGLLALSLLVVNVHFLFVLAIIVYVLCAYAIMVEKPNP